MRDQDDLESGPSPGDFKRRVLPNGRTVAHLHDNETTYLYREIFEKRCYARAEVPADGVVVDVGANIGMFSLFALETWPRCHVLAFEPIPELFDVLLENLRHRPGARAFRVALGDVGEWAPFTYYPRCTLMSGRHADPESAFRLACRHFSNIVRATAGSEASFLEAARDDLVRARLPARRIYCPVARLSTVLAELAVSRVHLLKIDAEGSELEVLKGIDAEDWTGIGRVVLEVDDRDHKLANVVSLLEQQGYGITVEQEDEFAGTDVHLVWGTRDRPRSGVPRSAE